MELSAYQDEEEFTRIATTFITSLRIGIYQCFLDEERRDFFGIVMHSLYLLNGGYISGNSHHRLVVGPKGTGKSSFLSALCLTAQILLPSVLAIYVDTNDILRALPPLTLSNYIRKACVEANFLKAENVVRSDLIKWLQENNLKLFLVLDEYHISYALDQPTSHQLMLDVYHLVNDRSGTCMVTVCGSSPYLRSLCFGKLDSTPFQKLFPGYRGLSCNLNSARTHVHSIGPILEKSTFVEYVKQYRSLRDYIDQDENNVGLIFLLSGGIRRKIDELATTRPADWVTPLKNFHTHKLSQVWGNVWAAMILYIQHRSALQYQSSPAQPWRYMSWIDCSDIATLIKDEATVRSKLTEWEGLDAIFNLDFNDLGKMFRGADDGAFGFELTQSSSRIRFAVPYHYEFMHGLAWHSRRCPEWFTAYYQLCLSYPYGVLGIDAEHVVARCLFMHKFPEIDYTGTTILTVKFKDAVKLDKIDSISIGGNTITASEIKAYNIANIFKESPDWLGCDLVVLKDGKEARYQVKLGKKPIEPKEAEKIATKLDNGILLKKTKFKQKSTNLFTKHLITSRNMSDVTKNIFTDHDIQVVFVL